VAPPKDLNMRMPLAMAGLREMVVLTLLFGGSAAVCYWGAIVGCVWCWPVAILLTLAWLAGMLFFRDPERKSPTDPKALISAADGKLVEIAELDSYADIGQGPATRISVFLSVLDVHINRSPCSGIVKQIRYEPGKFLDARHPKCGAQNEANTIIIEPDAPHVGPVVVRQIAGLIARRIVCSVAEGDRVEAGQRIGLIKFGSRTEVIVPGHDLYEPCVSVGNRARGAVTILAKRTN
jgi:phosphatidylserine decarboxylase